MASSAAPIGEYSLSLITATEAQEPPFPALLSVYDKAGLLPFAEGLAKAGVRLLGSGGTAKAIRNAGMEIG